MTGKICPEMVIAPVRLVISEFLGTVYLIVPLPVPLAPEVMVIQGVLVVAAVQGQPAGVETAMLKMPPGALIVALVGVKTDAAAVLRDDENSSGDSD